MAAAQIPAAVCCRRGMDRITQRIAHAARFELCEIIRVNAGDIIKLCRKDAVLLLRLRSRLKQRLRFAAGLHQLIQLPEHLRQKRGLFRLCAVKREHIALCKPAQKPVQNDGFRHRIGGIARGGCNRGENLLCQHFEAAGFQRIEPDGTQRRIQTLVIGICERLRHKRPDGRARLRSRADPPDQIFGFSAARAAENQMQHIRILPCKIVFSSGFIIAHRAPKRKPEDVQKTVHRRRAI